MTTETVRSRRKALGLPMLLASQAAGVSIGAWSAIETGTATNPGLTTARGMARVLGLTLDQFAELLQNSE